MPFDEDNAQCDKLMKTRAKIHELLFKLLPQSLYSPDLAPSEFYLFADLKIVLAGKRFWSNAQVFPKINVLQQRIDTLKTVKFALK